MTKLGTLYILSAPSGAGKSSLLQAYLKDGTALASKISVSHTTRDPRPGEEHGKHYHFVQQTEFLNMVAQDEFIEYAQVFDNYYGTSKKAIEQELKQGFNVFLDIDWQGAQQVRKQFPKAVSIFILPPSLSELHKRLISRQQDSEEVIKKRMQQAESEISHYPEYDYVIINDEFSVALEHFKAILLAESLKVDSENLWDPQVEDFDQYLNRLKINT